MIDAARLLADLQGRQKKLEADLREQIAAVVGLKERLEADYQAARAAQRTGDGFSVWCDGEITQAAVAWLLACVFLRFCEDNGLAAAPLLAGPGEASARAKEAAREYFRVRPTDNDRHYLLHAFADLAKAPAVAGLYDPARNALYRLPISADAAEALVAFWRGVDPDTGELERDFRDPALDTRFLGDLYQDLSEAARKRYALLQTPRFVEEFILDRTLDPAIETFGLEQVRLIDPTCGSGHFLLGAFARLNALYEKQGVEPRERVKRALASVYGVDLNPFAVAIARFRLLIAALQATGIRALKEAPGWKLNVTAGDSLLHGGRFGELDLGSDELASRYGHCFFAEDRDEIDRILGQQYHAVVGNPPYITVKDAALNALYRTRYRTCHMKYSLGVPFTERFIQLALSNGSRPAGFVGLITTNSFMKREFGKKLIQDYLPSQDLTHLIDTSGAPIPGHGTSTVILLARHRSPVGDTVRAVLGIRGVPETPEDPAQGRVWRSILDQIDRPGSQSEFVSASDMPRATLAKHPWSLAGGSAPDVLGQVERGRSVLGESAEQIGIGAVTGCDDVMVAQNPASLLRQNVAVLKPLVIGDTVRDWALEPLAAVWPHDAEFGVVPEVSLGGTAHYLWPFRSVLNKRKRFGTPMLERGLTWYEFQELYADKYRTPLSITFAFVNTHNHFVLDRGGKVFNRSAPVIKLPAGADEAAHVGLLGLLNSSTALFWLRQNSFGKGGDHVGTEGARVVKTPWEERYEFTATGLQRFPVADLRPLELATRLDRLAQTRAAALPAALSPHFATSRAGLMEASRQCESLLLQMIAAQEELDWWCYRAYDLLEDDLCIAGTPPEINLGERAFEIVMARRIAAGELETTWFKRHGSTPITELPAHWPAEYRKLVERRIELIESHPWVGLIEKPEYKRRWNQPDWEELEQTALRSWLLDRLEMPAYWPESALQTVDQLTARAERDADFIAVAALSAGQGFALRPFIAKLLADESVPALEALRYKDSGLRTRAEWKRTWDLQRQEDAIDAEVSRELPRQSGESNAEWEARLKPEQTRRKRERLGEIAAPPKYSDADFLTPATKRLRGDLDVPKERFFTLPKGDAPGEHFFGWAGWNHAQRVQAIAAIYTDAESRQGWPVPQLVPLLAAVHEELPWVRQWHNQIDGELGVRLGDYFREWLGAELQKHGLTPEALEQWRPERVSRRRRRA